MTCRIAAKEYVFQQFTDVEIADFDDEQIEMFVKNWFRSDNTLNTEQYIQELNPNKSIEKVHFRLVLPLLPSEEKKLPKANRFMRGLEGNQSIKQLVKNPLLLTMLCGMFDVEKDFPKSRLNLYEECIRVLLKEWDDKRGVQRGNKYKRLNFQEYKNLLGYIALQTFQKKKDPKDPIQQFKVEEYIANFFDDPKNLDSRNRLEVVDHTHILNSIQAENGVLLEKTRRGYSFSHLSFQEYFTAYEVTSKNKLDILMKEIGKPKWREVFCFALEMLENVHDRADKFIVLMKNKTDLLLEDDQKIQRFLQWVNRKSSALNVAQKSSLKRAFYFTHALRQSSLDHFSDHSYHVSSELMYLLENYRMMMFQIQCLTEPDCVFCELLGEALTCGFECECEDEFEAQSNTNNILGIWSYLRSRLNKVIRLTVKNEANIDLAILSNTFPNPSLHDDNKDYFRKWWKENGRFWVEDLRQIMITHYDIGHDWQFTDEQKQILKQYYDANILLVQCLNSDYSVSRHVRQSIENTLILPYEKLRIENIE
jgi:predicted NACHT family NTPase